MVRCSTFLKTRKTPHDEQTPQNRPPHFGVDWLADRQPCGTKFIPGGLDRLEPEFATMDSRAGECCFFDPSRATERRPNPTNRRNRNGPELGQGLPTRRPPNRASHPKRPAKPDGRAANWARQFGAVQRTRLWKPNTYHTERRGKRGRSKFDELREHPIAVHPEWQQQPCRTRGRRPNGAHFSSDPKRQRPQRNHSSIPVKYPEVLLRATRSETSRYGATTL